MDSPRAGDNQEELSGRSQGLVGLIWGEGLEDMLVLGCKGPLPPVLEALKCQKHNPWNTFIRTHPIRHNCDFSGSQELFLRPYGTKENVGGGIFFQVMLLRTLPHFLKVKEDVGFILFS